ncbi:MAG: DNA polymerase III subunit delta [Clostridia bacterium]|nr:DNA polymerase III subunit delta [Clostridia bacterium]
MHEIIREADYRKRIGKSAGTAFLFFGKEDYLKAAALRATREAICPDPSFAVFNDIAIDALDFEPDRLLDAMTPPPMMADERLIVLRGFDFTAMRAAEVDALLEALSALPEYPYNTVIVSVAAGALDEGYLPKRPSATLKKLATVLEPVRFETPSDARLAVWAGKHFAHHGVRVSQEDCAFLVSFVGQSMFVLANEIEKLSYYALSTGKDHITAADIRTVAVPVVAADAFALSNAILAGRSRDALDALAVMKFERIEPTVVLAELSRTLSDMQAVRILLDAGRTIREAADVLKLHEYKAGLLAKAATRTEPARLARAVRLSAEADATLKRASGDYGAIERLICAL